MNSAILHPDVQKFILEYEGDIDTLAFAGSPFPEISIRELLEQIHGRQQIRYKLPTWYAASNIYYPPKLNLEQTSSEQTAIYKSELFQGSSMADITGGFGVDTFYFAKNFNQVDHFEESEALSMIATKNFITLGVTNVQCRSGDGIEGVKDKHYDLIYVDPSRRTREKRKVFLLADCTPDIVSNLDYLLSRTEILMIKTSPMLDISIGVSSLKKVKELHVVAVNNEVKELLWILTSEVGDLPKIVTMNLMKDLRQSFEFKYGSEENTLFGEPGTYLYEPNAAIMKSGGFSVISEVFGLQKLHKHSHLFTGENLIDFPGRRFRINKVVHYNRKDMKSGIDFSKANIAVRNFPESVETIRKKWGIKEGGSDYVFFTTVGDEQKMMLVCEKI